MTDRPLILIVDDTNANVQLLANMLEDGYRIAIAGDGSQALAMIADTIPDLILLDVMMPGIDGFEVCRRLKEDVSTAHIPVIFLTAKTETEDIVMGFRAGGVDYLTKPFILDELCARISVHLRLRKLVNELELKNTELKHLAETDALTGIANRRFILARLEETLKLASRHKFPVAVLMLDIDFFKKVNDTRGHQTGDEVLVKVAQSIRNSIRETDWLGRIGGEEFLACLPYTSLESGAAVAEKIRASVECLAWAQEGLHVTISGGLTIMASSDTLDSIIARADSLLYAAKEAGRNRVHPGE